MQNTFGHNIMSMEESLNKLLEFFGTIKDLEYLIVVYMFASVFGSYMSQMAKGREKVLEMGVAGILGTIAAVALNIYLLLYLKLGFIVFFQQEKTAKHSQNRRYGVLSQIFY